MAQRVQARGFVGLRRISASTSESLADNTRRTREELNQIFKNLSSLIGSIEGATPTAVEAGLRPIFNKSQRYVPVDTGALKISGEMKVEQKGEKVIGTIGYGAGGDPFYAAYVHEMTELKHDPPTRSKFLQAAVEEELPLTRRRIVAAIRKQTKLGE